MNKIQKKSDSYRSIFKATSFFGGVQVFHIFISIIRAKVVAVLIGSEGMGLNGLFINTRNLISSITGLGIDQSAVKNIAEANASEDKEEVVKVISIVRKLIWATAFLSFGVAVLLGKQFSVWVFGTTEHIWSFRILGITFLFGAITAGTFTVLQGLRKIKFLAMANVFGTLFGLLVSIPLYYFYGIKGVVPALIASAFVQLLISRYFQKQIDIKVYSISYSEAFKQGSGIIKLGLVLASTTFLATGVKFAISAFITRTGSLSDLGLYNAGFAITTGYTGMIFNAMTKDYFPRMTEEVNRINGKWRRLINEQTHLVTVILTPLLILILTFLPIMIKILLTDEFQKITDFVSFFILGIFLKGPTWTMGILIVAKGDLKVKMYSELLANIMFLVLNISFYYFYGLTGIGVGFLLSRIFSFILTYSITRFRYHFTFDKRELYIIVISFLLCAFLSSIQIVKGYPFTFYTGIVLLVLSLLFSYKEFNKKLDIKELFTGLINKFLKK